MFWAVVVVVVAFGVVCPYFGYRAGAEQAEDAAGLIGGYAFGAADVLLMVIGRPFS
jgi:hypothetical protein